VDTLLFSTSLFKIRCHSTMSRFF